MTQCIITTSIILAKQARATLDSALGLPSVGSNAGTGQQTLVGLTSTSCDIIEAYDWPSTGVTSYVLPIRPEDVAAASSAGLSVSDVDLSTILISTVYTLSETIRTTPVEPTLDQAKQARFHTIDLRTDAIIAAGYEYPPGSGVRYSTSIESQTRILGLMIAAGSMTPDQWPVPWNSLDDTHCAILSNVSDVQLMYACGMACIKQAVLSGTTLKDQVRAATTIDQINAIVDPR